MMKMTEQQLIAVINNAERDTLVDGDMVKLAESILDRYNMELYGNEESDRSQILSSDVLDIIESDMPSLARVMLGSGDVCQFQPTTSNPLAIQEAEEKQVYIPWIINNIKNSFRTQHGWLKGSEMQPFSMLEYGIETITKAEEKNYKGIDIDLLTSMISDFEQDDGITSVDVGEKDQTKGSKTFDVKIKLKKEKQEYFLRSIPFEDIIISRNAIDKDADVIGYRIRKTRSDLIAEGYDKELVMSLPTKSSTADSDSTLKQKRNPNEINDDPITIMNELVDGVNLYINVDYDGDGVAERRHVLMAGNKLLTNEVFEHVPFSIISSILMQNTLAGRCRGELALEENKIQTFLKRGLIDNISQVNNPRLGYDENTTDIDMLLDARLAGPVAFNGPPANSVLPITIPYIADGAMQVAQYFSAEQAERTGNQVGNQGLDSDQLTQETATRFQGIEKVGQAKIELVARVIAEVGYRDLYEGLAWFASHYQDKAQEVFVLGKPMTIDPNKWRFDHRVVAEVGTGAGDDTKAMEVLSGIYSIQKQLIDEGSTLADNVKRYNTLKRMTQKAGLNSPEPFFNDPSQPEAVVAAERDILKKTVTQMEQALMQSNPLAEAESIKQQSQQQMAQLKGQIEMSQLMAKIEQERNEMIQNQQQFMEKMQKEQQEFFANQALEYTKLELQHQTDIQGQGQ